MSDVETVVEAAPAVELEEDETLAQAELDALVSQYLQEGDTDHDRYMAAFEAGTLLRVVEPLEIYDPIDDRFVRVDEGEILAVASHEGDVLVGQLADNSHSIGVLYEEAHRWYQRKYFLALGLLTSREKIEIDPEVEGPAPLSQAPLKGAALTGEDRRTGVAVRRIEALELRDQAAFLPRGVRLIFRDGVAASDPSTGEAVSLPPGAEGEVLRPVGDALDDLDAEIPPVQIRVGERHLEVPFEVIATLDPDQDVLTLANLARRKEEALSRRTLMRRLGGLGLGALLLGGAGGSWALRRESLSDPAEPRGILPRDEAVERVDHQTLAAIVPIAASLYGYFTSGNQYWWALRGAIMSLREQGCQPTVEALGQILRDLSAVSSSLWGIYEGVYHRRVHVGWSESRHYRTDSKGKRHYSHSTWHKQYRTIWVEPAGLDGRHQTLSGWSNGDEHAAQRVTALASHPLFDILAADPEHPERTFAVDKTVLAFGRDAAVSMVAMALMTLPPAFYDELVALAQEAPGPSRTAFASARGLFPFQKEAATVAGLAAGVVLSRRYQAKLQRRMAENKYELGATLEREIRRVPDLDLDHAFSEHVGAPFPAAHEARVREREAVLDGMSRHMTGFRYRYGAGFSHGRPLDSIYVDPSPLLRALPQIQPQWRVAGDRLAAFFADAHHRDRLLPVLQNAIGTETVEGQIREDRGEATGGSWKRAMWFSLPLYGAVMLDALVKGLR